MYSNTELMYQLQKFENKLNQNPRPLKNAKIHYEVGYRNASALGAYYYVNEIIEDLNDDGISEQFLVTIDERTGETDLGFKAPTELTLLIQQLVKKLKHHDLIEIEHDNSRPSIQLHPVFGKFDEDTLHP